MIRYKRALGTLTALAGLLLTLTVLWNGGNGGLEVPEEMEALKGPDEEGSQRTEAFYSSCQGANPPEVFPCDISTGKVFNKLKFDAEWMQQREFWNNKFEKRYSERRTLWPKLPLKVFILPHSHNDPGWLKTVETYFASATHKILDLAVEKLSTHPNMTFIWSEVAFLHLWWSSSSPTSRARLASLIDSGRFEISSGGWVVPDEASSTAYSLLDQLIEGHSWLRAVLGLRGPPATHSWSIDPFGHGAAFPQILSGAGITGHVIMRIHYAWKEWFAKRQSGDFLWRTPLSPSGAGLLTHNFPYDIYSIKGSCGPFASVCLEYNFRRLPGELHESRSVPLTPQNLPQRAERLLEQYGRTGSLYPHNVVLVPLGDDFTYANPTEWDQQMGNYSLLMDYINARPQLGASLAFGTLADYFNAVRERMSDFSGLCGDFFPYADVFSEGRPAYWTGYYSSRPRMKALGRRVEAHLREAEILFTLAYNGPAKATGDEGRLGALMEAFGASLVPARRALALFQHHDALTGTSKQYVMEDYEKKLHKALHGLAGIRKEALGALLMEEDEDDPVEAPGEPGEARDLLVFNSHAETYLEAICVLLPTAGGPVRVQDDSGSDLPVQVSPGSDANSLEACFFVRLPGLSLVRLRVSRESGVSLGRATEVYGPPGTNGSLPGVTYKTLPLGDIVLENSVYTLTFSSGGGSLRSLVHKPSGVEDNLEVLFGKYGAELFRSGAYLLKPSGDGLRDFLDPEISPLDVHLVSGAVYSQLVASAVLPLGGDTLGGGESRSGAFTITLRLYHAPAEAPLARGISLRVDLDLGGSLLHRDTEVFMRVSAGNIRNGGSAPVIFSDSSGLLMSERVRNEALGPEGNFWPLSSAAYMEDDDARVSILADHSQGVSGPETGTLELLLDRRSSYDDARGMGEGLMDSKGTSHTYWLLYEPRKGPWSIPALSPTANFLSGRLNYPPQSSWALPRPGKTLRFLSGPSLCQGELLNLRTESQGRTTPPDLPAGSSLLVLKRPTLDCGFEGLPSGGEGPCAPLGPWMLNPELLRLKESRKTGLTGGDVPETKAIETLTTFRLTF